VSRHNPEDSGNPARDMKIAITGSRGFVGRRLVSALERHKTRFVLLEIDVRLSDAWNEDFNVLIHLAAATPVDFASDPGAAFRTNVGGVINALEACRQRNAAFVFPSTCGVYRPVGAGPVSEASPVEAKTAYASSKLMGEMICESYAVHYEIPCHVLRFFNIYGGGQEEPFVIPHLLRSSLEGITATVRHPDSARDFIHVDDVVDSLLKASASKESGFRVLNIGSGEPHTVRELIDLIGQVTGKAVRWAQAAGPDDTHDAIWADIQRAKEHLGWTPKINLRDGLTEAAEDHARGAGGILGQANSDRND
jgi:nucleoside-diphosphate-sugar epimerase